MLRNGIEKSPYRTCIAKFITKSNILASTLAHERFIQENIVGKSKYFNDLLILEYPDNLGMYLINKK